MNLATQPVWKMPLYENTPLASLVRLDCVHQPEKASFPAIDPQALKYIIAIGIFLEFSPATVNHALVLASKVNSFGRYERQQLLSLICLSLASKLFECKAAGFNTLHRMSCHSFTNQDFTSCESRVLTLLNFNLLCPDELMTHRLRVTYLLIAPLYPKVSQPVMTRIMDGLSWVVMEDQPLQQEFEDQRVMTAGLIIAATVLATGHAGRFPVTWRLSTLNSLSEESINAASKKILKRVLGREFFDLLEIS